MKQLILGGARSGKSRFGESQATASGKQKIYLATGQARDAEMNQRIQQHQARRDGSWILVEEPLELASTILNHNLDTHCILVDCLTLWLSNCLHVGCYQQQKDKLLSVLPTLSCDVIFIGNEVGAGVVPLGELTREFVDQNGWLHQSLATECDAVYFVTAGLPMQLK
ncbi:bifunctional adenosylcobinamide kinase/adenosylcobinamide-phosphate guanylyltransferase [Teredinibacter sp. KSP-S5-2]|uniref:bifunctional adenosylcobinamide kinase/adenosylcobinamide-phosphate guanylyltransferase n=1 Tax=Teredinibacter sp. KSP-S5-2 TaxID=3034506 RepID=UPI002934E5FE|nr:bifunctional adenosylcobinamide kinase/adenosylcobinamide-phosphate guanylyltransferase [Teredinibacter sp. KSP-S5-2]WNO08372.1 bifunctional adenosylcobinamide kinase/adenosylcobinamide-phosphate guanylyltransferase [Teredinibacter sp. KSP-S5-2]